MVQKGGILPITAYTVERYSMCCSALSEQCFFRTMDNIIAVMVVKNCVIGRHDAKLWMADVDRKAIVSAGVRHFPFKSELNERLTKNIFPLPVEALHVVLECDADVNNSVFLLRQTSRHRNLSL